MNMRLRVRCMAVLDGLMPTHLDAYSRCVMLMPYEKAETPLSKDMALKMLSHAHLAVPIPASIPLTKWDPGRLTSGSLVP